MKEHAVEALQRWRNRNCNQRSDDLLPSYEKERELHMPSRLQNPGNTDLSNVKV